MMESVMELNYRSMNSEEKYYPLTHNEFIELARKVYHLNDKRAEIKKDINIKTKSNFIEEKSYEKY